MADAAPLLATRNVIKRFGGVAALKGVSLTVEAGTVHGLLGENGVPSRSVLEFGDASRGVMMVAGQAASATGW